ncbi:MULTISPECIES: PAS domain S-box protein [unclassified Bacillus (in: firmicutes)]|uniref:PAS domain S-box protein n=1 Tax=unclassified Bacillus (in: firmicutes) TaxID=185979 RepID=UPI0020C8369E|nr:MULTISPECIES: PAS domain S-box protein [unclassified Bacillus (in: firmicutes)]
MILSVIWILGTNYLLEQFTPSPFIHLISRVKEIFYVVLTGWFIYYSLKKTEELNASKIEEQRLSTLINSMVDFVNFKDGDGRWIEANEFGLKLFQLENVDYRGKTDSELAEYSEFYAEALRYCETSDEVAWKNGEITRVEESIPLPDGTLKTFDTIKVPLFHPDGSRKGLVIIGRDITERIRIEKLLEESKHQYNSLFEYTPDVVYMLDLEGNITNLNPQFELVTGFTVEGCVGRNIHDILPVTYKETFIENLQKVLTKKAPQHFEMEIQHASGRPIMVECISLPIVADGKVNGIIGYAKDLTLLRQTEERLRRTEKLSVVGELSASVAHEIRNPLTSLKGFVQILSVEDERHQFYYQIMLDELDRINHIVSELLLLAKPQKLQYAKADLQNILYTVISLLKTEATLYNVEIDFKYPEEYVWIECESNQLKQLFINIIKNAIEASPSGSNVAITLKKPSADEVSITIKDSGYGISEEFLKRIGEPFYSSKEKGTGLGLTVSQKIVEAHHGTMKFSSKMDEGTEVLITLPVSKKEATE